MVVGWYIFDRRLPRVSLLRVYRSRCRPSFGAFRLPNHWHLYVWKIEIVIRAPWLRSDAAALYGVTDP